MRLPPPSRSTRRSRARSATPPAGIDRQGHLTRITLFKLERARRDRLADRLAAALGGSGVFWLSQDGDLRIELPTSLGAIEIVAANGKLTLNDPATDTVYELTLPASGARGSGGDDSRRH